jgi:dihydroorotate dehydrogenase
MTALKPSAAEQLATYRIEATYDWNYAHAPAVPMSVYVPDCPGGWSFCGLPLGSPLGMPAGPLLNSGWILYYAALGFDVLTYKTVRSSARASHPLPNLLPIKGTPLSHGAETVVADPGRPDPDSWAISFGMPSKDPVVWQQDVEAARKGLARGKVLVVSVVASPDETWTLDRIAADFALCARHAADAGAHAVEANLSCPNVCSQEGSLYQSPHASGAIAAAIRLRVPELPLVLKVGLMDDPDHAAAFVRAIAGSADAISTTNTITAVVRRPDGTPLFGGLARGIGGRAIGARCRAELATLRGVIEQTGAGVRLVSVGGVGSAADVVDRLQAGAHHVQIATAAMLNPRVGLQIREQLVSIERSASLSPSARRQPGELRGLAGAPEAAGERRSLG